MNIKQKQYFTTIIVFSLWMHQVTVFIFWKYCPCVWSLEKSLKWLITGTLITCADNEANLANQHIKLKLMMRSRHKNDVYTKLKLSLLLIVEINDDISKFHIIISYWSSTCVSLFYISVHYFENGQALFYCRRHTSSLVS